MDEGKACVGGELEIPQASPPSLALRRRLRRRQHNKTGETVTFSGNAAAVEDNKNAHASPPERFSAAGRIFLASNSAAPIHQELASIGDSYRLQVPTPSRPANVHPRRLGQPSTSAFGYPVCLQCTLIQPTPLDRYRLQQAYHRDTATAVAHHFHIAVRGTRMVEEACDVSLARGIDEHLVIKTKNAMLESGERRGGEREGRGGRGRGQDA